MAINPNARQMYLQSAKEMSRLKGFGRGTKEDIDIGKYTENIKDLNVQLTKALSVNNIKRARELTLHLSKAKEIKKVVEQIQSLNKSLRAVGLTKEKRWELNVKLMEAQESFKDLREEMLNTETAMGKMASRIESLIGVGAFGAGFWGMTQNTLKLEAATIGYGIALDKTERVGGKWTLGLIDMNHEIKRFDANMKAAKDYGVPIEAMNEALDEMIPYTKILNTNMDTFVSFMPKLGGMSRLIRQDFGDSVDYAQTRMLKMGRTQEQVLEEMALMRSVTENVNKEFKGGALLAEDLSNAIYDITKNSRSYSVNIEWLSMMMGKHVKKMKEAGKNYQEIKDNMEAVGKVMTDVPEWWAWELGEKVFGGIDSLKDLEEFLKSSKLDANMKSRLRTIYETYGEVDKGLFQKAAFEAIQGTSMGMEEVADKIAFLWKDNKYALLKMYEHTGMKETDILEASKKIVEVHQEAQRTGKTIEEVLKSSPESIRKGVAPLLGELAGKVGEGLRDEIKWVNAFIRQPITQLFGGGVVVAHKLAMIAHTKALFAASGKNLFGGMGKWFGGKSGKGAGGSALDIMSQAQVGGKVGGKMAGLLKTLRSPGARALGGLGGAAMMTGDYMQADKTKGTGRAIADTAFGAKTKGGASTAMNIGSQTLKYAMLGSMFGPWGILAGAGVGLVGSISKKMIDDYRDKKNLGVTPPAVLESTRAGARGSGDVHGKGTYKHTMRGGRLILEMDTDSAATLQSAGAYANRNI